MRILSYLQLLFLVSFPWLKAIGQDEMLKHEIQNQFVILRQLSREMSTKLEYDYSNTASSESKTKNGILVVNIPQLKDMVQVMGRAYERDLIRLIIAHELGHQIQYRFYSNIAGGLLYECQADIIAAFLLYQVIAQEISQWIDIAQVSSLEDPRYKKKMDELNNRFYASLTAIFNAGEAESRERTHPNNNERRLALRDGFMYGNLWLYGEVLANVPATSNTPQLTVQTKNQLANHYKKLLNYLPGDNLLTWSQRHAKKIIHEFLLNCKNIAVYSMNDWDTSAENPFVYYKQNIVNKGDKIITLNYYNQVYTVKREDPKNTLYWDLRSTKSHSVTLQPGEKREIVDSLEWIATKEYMPRFVYLGSEGSLFSCTTVSDKVEYFTKQPRNHFSDPVPTSGALILDIYLTSRSNFETFIGSVGKFYTLKFYGDMSFRSLVQLPSAESTEINYIKRKDRYDLEAKFYTGGSRLKADEAVQTIIQSMDKNEFAIKKQPETVASDDKFWIISDRSGEDIGKITYYHFDSGNYRVSMSIYGVKL